MDLKEYLFKANGVYTTMNNMLIKYCLEAGQNIGKPEVQNLIVTGHPFVCLGAIVAYKLGKINEKFSRRKNLETKL